MSPNRMLRWMPTMPMVLVSARNATATMPAKATFRVLPKMTKHEIKEYLTKIYSLPVKKVNTANYLGKRKKIMTARKIHYYRYADFKKAFVTFDKTMQDVGKGASMPELENINNE